MGATKRDQITFRLEEEVFKESQDAARDEDLKVADFARKLHKSAMALYHHFGSLGELRKHVEKVAGDGHAKRGKKTA